LDDGHEVNRFPLAAAPIYLSYSPDGQRFAAISESGGRQTVSVHDTTTGATQSSHVFDDQLGVIDWHPGGRWIAVADGSGAVTLIDTQTAETRILGHHKAQGATTIFSPDGQYLFSGGWERELICWDLRPMQRAFTVGLDSFLVQFRADGRQCAIITKSAVQLHAFERPTHREFAEDLGARLRRAVFSSDGRWLAASADNRGAVWDLARGGPGALAEEAFEAHLFFTPDGREMFGSRSRGEGGDCFRWRITPATNAAIRLERLPIPKPGGFTFLCLNSNAVVLTSSKGSQILALEEIESGSDRWARTSPGITGASPDGRWLGIYRPYSTSLYIYSLPGLERVAKLAHPANIGGFEFCPSMDEVAIVSSRGGLKFWSTKNWERTRALNNFRGIVFAADGHSWWLTKDSRTAGLYDSRTLEALLLLPSGMLPLALSPDGCQLAVSLDARRLQLWDMAEVRKTFRDLGVDWQE
jgi:WD40 repeat protein